MPTHLLLLGSGTPNAAPDRAGPAAAVIVDGVPYLVDCGAVIFHRIQAARARGIAGLEPANLTRLFLTHLHPDHVVGLPDLLLTPWVLERSAPLQIWGPTGTAALAEHIHAAYAIGIQEHVRNLAPIDDSGHRAQVTEITPGVIYRDARVQVEALRVQHGTLEAYAYRFTTAERVIVISGDTRPVPALAHFARHADVLLHEVYAAARLAQRPPAWQRYHLAVHTGAHDLGRLAHAAQPRLLVLTHQLFWGAGERELIAEVRTHFGGAVVSGRDLDLFG